MRPIAFFPALALVLLFALPAEGALLTLDLRPENRTILVPGCREGTGRGEGTLQINIFAPEDMGLPDRPRLNLVLVVDRSGSMGDDRKLGYVKQAAHALIDRLAPDDVFSLVAYDDQIEVPVPAQVVEDRGQLHRKIEELYPRGRTFLSGGLEEGFRQGRAGRRKGYLNRVLLLSDGLANVGVVDRGQIAEMAGEMRGKGTSLTTMGVGADFDEDLLAMAAMAGGGTYYYLARPCDIVAALQRELMTASRVAASSVEIVIRLRRGCSLGEVIGLPWVREGDDYVVRLGDLSAGERRSFHARLQVEGEALGEREVGEVSLRFRDPVGGKDIQGNGQKVSFRVVRDEVLYRQGFDQTVSAQRTVAAAQAMAAQAARLVDEGRKDEAKAVLSKAEAELAAAPCPAACAPAMQQALGETRAYSDSLDRLDGMAPGEIREMQKGVKYRAYQGLNNR